MKDDNKTPNVPTLRFSKSSKIWKKKRLKDFCEINPKTEELDEKFAYIDLESVYKGQLLIENIIEKETAPSRAQRVLHDNDILFQCVRPYQMNNLFFTSNHSDLQYVASTGYAQIRTNECASFVYHLLHTPNFNKDVMLRCTGSSYPAISSGDLAEIEVYICDVNEQEQIGHFLDLVEKRIEVQNKIISKYETLIKGIRHIIFAANQEGVETKLGDFLTEFSKRNNANNLETVAVGRYGIRKRSDIYSKELSADYSNNKVIEKDTLIIGMGSTQIDIGILSENKQYCVSPAYTTYKIAGIESLYLQEYLTELNPLLSKRYMVVSSRQGKSVNKSDLLEHKLYIHSATEQMNIVQKFKMFYAKLILETSLLQKLKEQKQYLLSKMFI